MVSDGDQQRSRALARLCGIYHNLTYYAPEIREFREVGISRYWHAYLAYRSAPMGIVPASVIVATFYNFAPRVVEEAIPAVWDLVSPGQAMAMRDDIIDRALRRALGPGVDSAAVAEAATLARRGIEGSDVVARPLFAAHTELPWPEPPHLELFRACTLWREHRGDGHNIALAAAQLDGLECHVLLAGKGVASAGVIQKIRGWTSAEWDAARDRLVARGLLTDAGAFTDAGRAHRDDVEAHTDRLAAEPRRRLGPDGCQRLIDLLEPVVEHLVRTGAVAGTWPPRSGVPTED